MPPGHGGARKNAGRKKKAPPEDIAQRTIGEAFAVAASTAQEEQHVNPYSTVALEAQKRAREIEKSKKEREEKNRKEKAKQAKELDAGRRRR